ncbi:major facilitator superfamily MFS_1 [Salinispora tropica CNB-440]|uniref:Major facilitator superfamily MFS_1 n=2 Tax=Salinispora tropica TaxID=168695 RepID=A4X445_SALTO|nr:major facilitator superfamily MFS_1 [Salinispora tropica CNB-440]
MVGWRGTSRRGGGKMDGVMADQRPSARYGYRSLGAEPGFRVRLAGAAASKLQAGMFSFALLYAVSAGRSYGVAALVVAVAALGGIAAPFRGRLLDRFGDRRVLWPILTVHVGSVTALSVNEGLNGPVLATFGSALVANVSMPPVGVLSRVMWRRMSQPQNVRSALALDAVLTDLAFVFGPALVGLLTETVSPIAGLVVSSGSSALATVLLLRAQAGRGPVRDPSRGPERGAGGARHWAGPLVLAPLRWLLLVACLFSAALHAVQIALPAAAGRSAGAALVSVLSVGSIVGGLVVGALRGRWVPRLPVLLLGLALACVALAVVGRLPLGLLVAGCLLVGLFIGPTFVALYGDAGDLAPSGTEAETQSWTGAAIQLGAAVGAAAGAAAIEGWAPLAAVGVAAVLALSGFGAGLRVVRAQRHRSRSRLDGSRKNPPPAERDEAGRLSAVTNNLDVPPAVDPGGRGVSARIKG